LAADALILLLRLALVLVLYGFLFSLVVVLRRELRSEWTARAAAPAATGASARGDRLMVLDGGAAGIPSGRVFHLRPETVIGRADGSDVRLDDRLVSAQHARLVRRNGTWYIADLQSTNGTVLNGHAIDGEQSVEVGDVIGVGGVRLELVR
jgi:pSer/pThr/pTyr-binding forkhead associated (FHA) protein